MATIPPIRMNKTALSLNALVSPVVASPIPLIMSPKKKEKPGIPAPKIILQVVATNIRNLSIAVAYLKNMTPAGSVSVVSNKDSSS
jgi:hypothetical protein